MIDLLPALFIFYMGLILGFQTAGLRHWKLHKSGWALRILLLAWVLGALIDMHAAAVTTAPANEWLFGLLLLTLGGGLFFWTGETLKSRQLDPAPLRGVDGLITEGPFRFVRHPFYLAYIFFWGAAPAVTMTPGPWIVFAGMTAFYVICARREEAFILESVFAPGYRAYQARAGMFWPKLGRR